MRLLPVAVLLMLPTSAALADQCRATVNGDEVVIEADNFATFAEDVKTREKLMSWPNRTWNRAWGSPVPCDSGVLYDYLATTVPDTDVTGYCLTNSAEAGYFLIPGERTYKGTCKTTLCEKVNTTKDQGVGIASSIARTAANNAREAGLNAIKHGSGAMILSGTASSVSASLGTAGSTALTALSSPAVLAAAGVSVVAVGGAVYLCSGDEAPEELPVSAEPSAVDTLETPATETPLPSDDSVDLN